MKKLKIILLFSYFCISIFTLFQISRPISYQMAPTEFEGKVIEIKEKENYIAYTIQGGEKIIAYDYNKTNSDILLGQIVRIHGKNVEIEKNRNFYFFNYQKYLQSKKIKYQITITNIEIIHDKIAPLEQVKNSFLTYLKSFEKTSDYMLLFLYGENSLEEEVYNHYTKIGIIHLFAISGMHISLFVFLLQKMIKKEKIQTPALLAFLTLYFFLTKSSPGITRAIWCENIYLLCKKRISRKQILFFVFFLMLLENPYFLYHTGFQLSFLLSFSLSFLTRERSSIKNLLKTGIFSFLVSLPIVVNMNFEVNLLTPIYNILFIPFVSFLLFPSILLTFFFPALENGLYLQITILEKVAVFLEKIPTVISFSYFTLSFFLLFYILLLLCFWRKKLFFLLFIFLVFFYFQHDLLRQSRITVLDVGQGDSILIESSTTILIDTGGENQKSKAFDVLIPSLKARGIHKLDALILTHGDFDHAGSALELLKNFRVDKVYLNGSKDTELEQSILALLNEKAISYQKITEEKTSLPNLGIILFHFKNEENENEDSLVTYIKWKTYNILLMGDAGEETEEKLIHTYKLPKMDILKVGHHGSKYSSSIPFLEQMKPQYALISCGKRNSYGHPSSEAVRRLTDLNTTIFKTSTDGSIELTLKPKLSIRTCLKSATQ